MTKEKAKHLAEVLNAYAEGKPIEVLLDGEWGEVDLNEYSFDERESYIIKKEPTYRPFKNAKECFEEMQKHQPFGWIKAPNGELFCIDKVFDEGVVYKHSSCRFEEYLDGNYTFADGTPFGIKEE